MGVPHTGRAIQGSCDDTISIRTELSAPNPTLVQHRAGQWETGFGIPELYGVIPRGDDLLTIRAELRNLQSGGEGFFVARRAGVCSGCYEIEQRTPSLCTPALCGPTRHSSNDSPSVGTEEGRANEGIV